jgi:hypothetical protein
MLFSLLLSLIVTIILCIILQLNTQDVVIVCIVSIVIVLLLDKYLNLENKVNNLILNNKLPVFNNNTIRLQKNKFVGTRNNLNRVRVNSNHKKIVTKKLDQIIPPNMYNQEDCTTDMSCVQKPDENNLFVDFNNNQEVISKLKKLSFEISKMENNLKHLESRDKIVVENFQNNHTPHGINDLVAPFNNSMLKGYGNVSNEKTIDYQKKMEIDGICFHCKVGTCEGGVCKSDQELKVGGLESCSTNLLKQAHPADIHPFTDDQPVIRMTNPGRRDFE